MRSAKSANAGKSRVLVASKVYGSFRLNDTKGLRFSQSFFNAQNQAGGTCALFEHKWSCPNTGINQCKDQLV